MPPKKKVAAEPEPSDDGLKKAKLKSGGNAKPDIAWLDAMSEAGRLLIPVQEERPPGFLYDVQYQWDGYVDDEDEELRQFFETFRRSPKYNCTASSYVRDEAGMYIVDNDWQRIKRQCLNPPGRGTTVCHAHGSKIPAVVAAAKQRLAEASEVVALRLITLTGTKDELSRLIRPQDRIVAAQAVLDRAGVKGGLDVEVSSTGFKGVMSDLFGAEETADGNKE